MEPEEITLVEVKVSKIKSHPMGPCIVNVPYIDARVLIAIPFILLGLTLSGALVPVVILIVKKVKKPKQKQS